MSSRRPKRSSKATSPANPRAKKKGKEVEEPLPMTEAYVYRSGLCKNKFVQDFRGRKVLGGRWMDFNWFNQNGFDFQEIFEYQGWDKFVTVKLDYFPYLVKLVYSNLKITSAENVTSYVNAQHLDLSVTSLNSVISAPNEGKCFYDAYSWVGMSEVEPIEILRVVLEDPTLEDIVKPMANALSVHRRILHHMVCNIILPRTGKFEYVTYLELFIMYCLITRTRMNLGHLMLNHMKAAIEKKKQGLPYGMYFTHVFHAFEVSIVGEVKEKPKIFQEYNEKTLKLMGYMKNDEGLWIKKGAGASHMVEERGSESEDESADEAEVEATDRVPMTAGTPPRERPPVHATTSPAVRSSRREVGGSRDSRLNSLAASVEEIKEAQHQLSMKMDGLSSDVKTGLEDIKKMLGEHQQRIDTVSEDVQGVQQQVNKSIKLASDVIQKTVDEFALASVHLKESMANTSREVISATERHLDADRNLQPRVIRWTYWFSTTWTNWLRKWDVAYDPPPLE
jgi:outer membrane murein-binding lipoprotein Lpp